MCGVAVVKKSDGQEQPCGISTAISCSLWNKALTVEASWENALGIGILLKALILTAEISAHRLCKTPVLGWSFYDKCNSF